MIERDRLITVNQTIGRGNKKSEGVFQYCVHAMFDKFSNKWWPSIYQKQCWIKYQAPEKENKDEMLK